MSIIIPTNTKNSKHPTTSPLSTFTLQKSNQPKSPFTTTNNNNFLLSQLSRICKRHKKLLRLSRTKAKYSLLLNSSLSLNTKIQMLKKDSLSLQQLTANTHLNIFLKTFSFKIPKCPAKSSVQI
jgi:hypothetical protein